MSVVRAVVLWSTLMLLTAIAAVHPVSSQTRPAKAASQASPPPGWDDVVRNAMPLTMDGKHRELVAIYEKWVARYPTFADAHLRLGGAYESLARELIGSRAPGAAAERAKLFETAAAHFRRAFDLGGGESPRIVIRVLIDIYGLVGLNRPDEAEKVVREAVERYPSEPIAHGEIVTLLLRKNAEPALVDNAVRAARASLPKSADARFEMASLLAFRAAGREPALFDLTSAAKATMATIALEMLDEVVTLNPRHIPALERKALLLRLQAKQAVEPARAKALADEADRVSARVEALKEERLNRGLKP